MLLIASKRVSYGGKTYNAGEQFSATKEHAGLLTTLRFAHYPPNPPVAKDLPEASGDQSLPKIKRKYKRRDKMTDAAKPKRQYRRRDMTAEETQSE